jgi:hypothetical protein
MKLRSFARRSCLYAATLGLCAANGCWATFQQSLDLLFGSDALENALLVPYSPVAELAGFLAQLFRG